MNNFRDRQIRAAMEALMNLWFADRIGVWELEGDDAVGLACDRVLSRADRQLARAVWSAQRTRLCQGAVLEVHGAEFHPLIPARQALIGFVQVFRPRPPLPSNPQVESVLDRALSYLTWALGLTDAPVLLDPAPAIAADRARDPRRADLFHALNRLRWDYTRLARAWGITRQTVFNWVRAEGLTPPPPYDRRHRPRR